MSAQLTAATRGRIFPHQRNANFSGEVLGENITIADEHVEGVQSIEQFSIDAGTKKNHRNRIKHIYEYWKREFPDYYSVGVRDLSNKELADPTKFYWKNKEDLVYDGLNSKVLKVFVATKTTKPNGKTASFKNIRKYFDAVQWGAKEMNALLPVSFYQAKEKFLTAFKKRVASKKGKGNMDENEADPIPMDLYKLISTWAVKEGNVMLHTWTLLQWNLMARSVNVEPLGLHNLKVFRDSLQFLYDQNKSDQEGAKTTVKHVYANPLNPFICPVLSLGIYVSLNASKFRDSEFLFKANADAKKKAATNNYCSQLKELLNRKREIVVGFIRLAHANAHGWRKGSATHATSGTTAPPPIPSVARRGEWSLGKVLDVYWHCAEPGDHYLGRVVSGLDPLSKDFGVLPAHFKLENPLENPFVAEAMDLMFGPILRTWTDTPQDPTGVLLRLLAAVVHHFDWIKAIAKQGGTAHPYNNIPLMFKPELVPELKELVTMEPSPVLKEATGIPPHVGQSLKLQKLLEIAGTCLEILKNQVVDFKQVSFCF